MPYRLDDEILTSKRRQRMVELAGILRYQLEIQNELDREKPSTALSAVASLLVLLTDEILAMQEGRKD